MSVRVIQVEFRSLDMRTRMPFRYGIAELRALPHWIVLATCEIDGRVQTGLSADGLAPKWFTKNPNSSVADDLAEMQTVIRRAARLAVEVGEQASVFDFWRALY